MLIPEGYSYDEVVRIILNVIEKQYMKYKFNIYDYDDMYQECYLICHSALERYKPEKGALENFLSFNLCNRLKILLRDKTRCPFKMLDIDTISSDERDNLLIEDEKHSELLEEIDHTIPARQRQDYLKTISGQKIIKSKKDRLRQTVLEILIKSSDND